MTVTVLDAGPIPYAQIELYGDPDLERALVDDDLDPAATCYRLVELDVGDILDTAYMPWRHLDLDLFQALNAGARVPPVVVVRRPPGWALLDGVHRADAHIRLGRRTIVAYELVT